MKKLLITASLIIGMIAGAMILSSFRETKQEKTIDNLSINVPHPLFNGYAYSYDYLKDEITNKIWITVWPHEPNKASWWNSGSQSIIRFDINENPNYNPEQTEGHNSNKYYISFFGKKYYFNMEK